MMITLEIALLAGIGLSLIALAYFISEYLERRRHQ